MTSRRPGRRGQTIVLMAFTATLMAFTLMTTFAIGKAIREKIQLQQAADAASYSLAVQEARTFNLYAYTNRAIVAHYVIMMSIYGHMSYLAAYEGYLAGLQKNWCDWTNPIGILPEYLYWYALYQIGCIPPFVDVTCEQLAAWVECVPDEISQIEDLCNNAIKNNLTNVDKTLGKSGGGGDLAGRLHDTATLHHDMAHDVIAGHVGLQSALEAELLGKAMLSQHLVKQVAQTFDPKIEAPPGVMVANMKGLTSGAAGYCDAVTGELCPPGGQVSLSTQQQAANASRYGPSVAGGGDWLRNRGEEYALPFMLSIADIIPPGERLNVIVEEGGMSREVVDPSSNAVNVIQSSAQGGGNGSGGGGSTSVAGEDHGGLISTDLTCVSVPAPVGSYYSVNVWAYSMPNGSGKNGVVHWSDGSELNSSSLNMGGKSGAYSGLGSVSTNFNPSTDPDALFNQPRTWAVLTRKFATPADEGPFAFDTSVSDPSSGAHKYRNVINDPSVAGREAIFAVSQGLAYYHRPGNWQEPPNFYNPFWRAKLQPIEGPTKNALKAKADYDEVLGLAGYSASAIAGIDVLPQTE